MLKSVSPDALFDVVGNHQIPYREEPDGFYFLPPYGAPSITLEHALPRILPYDPDGRPIPLGSPLLCSCPRLAAELGLTEAYFLVALGRFESRLPAPALHLSVGREATDCCLLVYCEPGGPAPTPHQMTLFAEHYGAKFHQRATTVDGVEAVLWILPRHPVLEPLFHRLSLIWEFIVAAQSSAELAAYLRSAYGVGKDWPLGSETPGGQGVRGGQCGPEGQDGQGGRGSQDRSVIEEQVYRNLLSELSETSEIPIDWRLIAAERAEWRARYEAEIVPLVDSLPNVAINLGPDLASIAAVEPGTIHPIYVWYYGYNCRDYSQLYTELLNADRYF